MVNANVSQKAYKPNNKTHVCIAIEAIAILCYYQNCQEKITQMDEFEFETFFLLLKCYWHKMLLQQNCAFLHSGFCRTKETYLRKYARTLKICMYIIATCIHIHTHTHIPYSAKQWQGKTLANRSFQSFGEENIGVCEFELLTNS